MKTLIIISQWSVKTLTKAQYCEKFKSLKACRPNKTTTWKTLALKKSNHNNNVVDYCTMGSRVSERKTATSISTKESQNVADKLTCTYE